MTLNGHGERENSVYSTISVDTLNVLVASDRAFEHHFQHRHTSQSAVYDSIE